nr:quinolinate synthase NadA [Nocardioides convexus]
MHFMAESADILTGPDQKVILPDLAAGCSMADMARIAQVEKAWDALAAAGVQDSVVPVTYMNSSADIKAFCGRNGGVVCTSSNAEVALDWAFQQKGADTKVLFLPDQHLGRNTAVLKLGYSLDECVVWNPFKPDGGVSPEGASRRPGSSCGRATARCTAASPPTSSTSLRAKVPDLNVLVHPECQHEVVLKADLVGSTEFIIKTIEAAPAGTRLGDRHRDSTSCSGSRTRTRTRTSCSWTATSATARR